MILNWNGAEDTLNCLKSIKKLKINNLKLKIIAVDNASSDGGAIKIEEFFTEHGSLFTEHMFIKNEQNLGYSGGNNVGIREALKGKADWVLVLNNDTLVDRHLITSLLWSAKKGVGAVSPKIYFAKGYEFHKKRYKKSELGRVVWAAGGEIDWDSVYGKNIGVDEVDRGQYEEETDPGFAPGTAMFLSSETLRKTGLFDERYFMYLEDMDLSMRIREAGYKILYQPKAVVWHKVAGSSAVGGELNDYFITRNRLLFGMHYAGMRAKTALIRESVKLFFSGRKWQKIGARDFYLRKLGKGSWK